MRLVTSAAGRRRAPRSGISRPVAVAMALALAATSACGTDGTTPPPPGNDAPRRGGTLYLFLEQAAFEHLDPQRNYVLPAMNVGRLIYRTLTSYRAAPGPGGSELVADLATDLGRPQQDNRLWEFTLKSGVKWEDGKEVSCADVKHGVERSFSSLLPGGPSWPRALLAGSDTYQGPYVGGNNGGRGLESVRCVDQRTVQFLLAHPVGDFQHVLAMPTWSPVRPDLDTRAGYDQHPRATGPYRVATGYDPATKEMVLERNPHWDQRTDPARAAYPDRMVFRFGQSPAQVTADLIRGHGDHQYGVQLDSRIPPEFIQQVVNDPALSRRTVEGPNGVVRYLAVNTRSVPDVRCRQALHYALDKQKFRAVMGGAPLGDYATTMLPPGMRAHVDFDLYDTRTSPAGSPRKAQPLLDQAGNCPKKLTLDHRDDPLNRRVAQTVVESFQRVGIQVTANPVAGSYYSVVSNPANQHDLVLAAWSADWANGSGTIPPLFHSRTTTTTTNWNFSLLADPQVDKLIEQAMAEPDPQRQYRLWGDLDRRIAGLAAVIPIMYDRQLQLVGPHVRGGYLHPHLGLVDIAALGVG